MAGMELGGERKEVGEREREREGESAAESVVLQGVEVEDGEEVQGYSKKARRLGGEEEEVEEEDEEGGDVSGGRIGLANEESGYWSSRRRRRCRGSKCFGEALVVVDRASVKRKHEADECGPVSESVVYDEDTDSDDSASSSDSDASDSEYEYWSRRATTRNKRRRDDGDEIYGTISTATDELRSSQHESVNCDDELKGMQQLLELQLQASERREAGMKQHMETMMEMMSKHMGHVEKRVCNLEVGTEPQDQILKRINAKLEKVMEGFTTLNENLSILSACLSEGLDSQ